MFVGFESTVLTPKLNGNPDEAEIKAEGFSFSLNLENLESLPDNPIVKVFVWDSTDTLFPLTQNYSHNFN